MHYKSSGGRRRSFQGRRNGGGKYNGSGNYQSTNGDYEVFKPDHRQVKHALTSRDKYQGMARDALVSGDRVLAEYYHQYADHFQRIINAGDIQPRELARPRDDNFENKEQDINQGRPPVTKTGDDPFVALPAYLTQPGGEQD